VNPQERQLLQRIEEDERWLAGVWREALPAPDLSSVKHAVRAAVAEEWLERGLRDEVPTGLAGRVKRQVRAELWQLRAEAAGRETESAAGPRRRRMNRPRLWLYRVGGGLAAAAAVALAFVTLQQPGSGAAPFSYVDAFDLYEADSVLTTEVSSIEQDLLDLEYAQLGFRLDVFDAGMFDELREAIDALTGELPGAEGRS